VPLLCASAFLWQTRDPFGAAVAIWWAGEDVIDVAPYINDARDLKLMLLGGRTGAEVEAEVAHDAEFVTVGGTRDKERNDDETRMVVIGSGRDGSYSRDGAGTGSGISQHRHRTGKGPVHVSGGLRDALGQDSDQGDGENVA
jgi:hypothetical protein